MARLVGDQLQQDQPQRFIVEQAPTTTAATAPAPATAARTIFAERVATKGTTATPAETVREGEPAIARMRATPTAVHSAVMTKAAMAAVRGMKISHHFFFHMLHDALRYILKIPIVKTYDISFCIFQICGRFIRMPLVRLVRWNFLHRAQR
jgi:hypothetical protein